VPYIQKCRRRDLYNGIGTYDHTHCRRRSRLWHFDCRYKVLLCYTPRQRETSRISIDLILVNSFDDNIVTNALLYRGCSDF